VSPTVGVLLSVSRRVTDCARGISALSGDRCAEIHSTTSDVSAPRLRRQFCVPMHDLVTVAEHFLPQLAAAVE
jgi:hypothetical protein